MKRTKVYGFFFLFLLSDADWLGPMQKGVFLFLSYTNMNKMNSLHHAKEHPRISNFLQFETCSSKSFKVRAISDLEICMEITSKASPASILISAICMIDS